MSDNFPTSGRLAGIDFGTVRIGVALSDPGQKIATPHLTYVRQRRSRDADWFRRLAEQQNLVGFLVGLPVFGNGQESPKSTEARQFGAWLQQETGLPVRFFDERFTTIQADEILAVSEATRKQRKQRRDMLAAQILLTSYLESHGPAEAPRPLDDELPGDSVG